MAIWLSDKHLHLWCTIWMRAHCRGRMRHALRHCSECVHGDRAESSGTICPTCKVVDGLLVGNSGINDDTLTWVTADCEELICSLAEYLVVTTFYHFIRLLVRQVNFVEWLSFWVFRLILVLMPFLWRVREFSHAKSLKECVQDLNQIQLHL